jgi:hypothetical protein
MGAPHILSGIRSLLLADSDFTTLLPTGRCFVRKSPPDVTAPFVVVQLAGNVPLDDRAWVTLPLIQVNAWCIDPYTPADPDLVTWDLINAALKVIANAHYVTFADSRGSATYRARITDTPQPAEDTSRGDGAPLQGYLFRAELTLQST